MDIIDISTDNLNCDVYPGDPGQRSKWVKQIGETDDYNLSYFSMTPHSGTHADAPLHFVERGTPIDLCPLDAFIGPCTVVKVRGGVITGEDAEKLLPENCERLLIKGGGRAFFMDESAQLFADSGIKLIGTDAKSIGCQGNEFKPHRAFLGSSVCILEGLDLSEVEPGNYFLFAAPLKLGGLEGAPVRAVLIKDYIFWSAAQR